MGIIRAFTLLSVGFLYGASGTLSAQDGAELADVGNFYPMIQDYADRGEQSLSYLARDWPEVEQWRVKARAKMLELLAFEAVPTSLAPEILETVKKEGYVRHLVRYSITPHRRTEAYLLIPSNLTQPAPAVLALHDHGGFYYFGKEKITDTERPPRILREHISRSYGGRPYANELARQGFVVLCPDAFYFGSQRIDTTKVAEHFAGKFPDLEASDLDKSVEAFNDFCWAHETIMAKYLFAAGTTWPGVLFHGDRASVDYLLSRPEVDAERVGCMGLSIGGFRSAHLFSLDPRIKAAVVAGWMTTYTMQLFDKLRWHTWMVYIPGQMRFFDVPDVVSLNAPRPLMVINCLRDALYPLEAMKSADGKLRSIYTKMGFSDRYSGVFYDVPHSLNVKMQDDAIDWLKRWLVR